MGMGMSRRSGRRKKEYDIVATCSMKTSQPRRGVYEAGMCWMNVGRKRIKVRSLTIKEL